MERIEAVRTADVAGSALKLLRTEMERAADERRAFRLNLSGGSTPLELYRRLAGYSGELPWERVELFWGDERFVPYAHADSNFGAARQTLLQGVPLPPERAHPWPILDTAEASAEAYASELGRLLGDMPGLPHFDLTLLGLGGDCHTASLFPGSDSAQASGWTVATRAPASGGERLSMTAEALSSSRIVLFLVSGPGKREALAKLLAPSGSDRDCPARSISAHERLLLLTDQPPS